MTTVELVLRGIFAVALPQSGSGPVYVVTPSVLGCEECQMHHIAEHEPLLFFQARDLAEGAANPASVALSERNCFAIGGEPEFGPTRFAISLRGLSLELGTVGGAVERYSCTADEIKDGKIECADWLLEVDELTVGMTGHGAGIDRGCIVFPATGDCAGRTSALVRIASGKLESSAFSCGLDKPLAWTFAARGGGASRSAAFASELRVTTTLADGRLQIGPGRYLQLRTTPPGAAPVELVLDNSPLEAFLPLAACPSDTSYCKGPLGHSTLLYQLSSARDHLLHGGPIAMFPGKVAQGSKATRKPPSQLVCEPPMGFRYTVE